jgi:hypothetical protein
MMRIKVKADVYVSTLDPVDTIEDLALQTEIALNSLGETEIGMSPIFGRGPAKVATRFHFHEVENMLKTEDKDVE